MGLRSLACGDCVFISHRGHGCLPLVSVVCCQVEMSAKGWSLVQGSPTECCVSEWQWNLDHGGPGSLGSVAPWKRRGCNASCPAHLSQLESCVTIVWRTASCCQHMWNLFISSDLYPDCLVVQQRDLLKWLHFFLLQFLIPPCTWHEGEKCLLLLKHFASPYFNTHCTKLMFYIYLCLLSMFCTGYWDVKAGHWRNVYWMW